MLSQFTAFFFSGRFNVTTRTPSSFSTSTVGSDIVHLLQQSARPGPMDPVGYGGVPGS